MFSWPNIQKMSPPAGFRDSGDIYVSPRLLLRTIPKGFVDLIFKKNCLRRYKEDRINISPKLVLKAILKHKVFCWPNFLNIPPAVQMGWGSRRHVSVPNCIGELSRSVFLISFSKYFVSDGLKIIRRHVSFPASLIVYVSRSGVFFWPT